MERTGAERHDLSREKRGAGAILHERGGCRTAFSSELSAGVTPRRKRADYQRRSEPAPARPPIGPGDRRRMGSGDAFALEDDARTGHGSAPGRAEYFPAPAR